MTISVAMAARNAGDIHDLYSAMAYHDVCLLVVIFVSENKVEGPNSCTVYDIVLYCRPASCMQAVDFAFIYDFKKLEGRRRVGDMS